MSSNLSRLIPPLGGVAAAAVAAQGWAAAGASTACLFARQRRSGVSSAGQKRPFAASAASAAQPEAVADQPATTIEGAFPTPRGSIRTDWTREEVSAIFNSPFLELVHEASSVHRLMNDPSMVQRCTLLSIKTGGCPEDCGYCSQSSHHKTPVKATKLMNVDEVYEAALRAKESGSTRFCMGTAWRGPEQAGERQWQRVLEMVRKVRGLGMEVCTTMGMINEQQARELAEAGVSAYNHNLDTSPEYYSKITKTRKYEDRLNTLETLRQAGISVCAGGIIGLGEEKQDRIGLLHQLATLPAHPESVPINQLVKVEGTPIGESGTQETSSMDLVRCIATARIIMPRSVIRLSAGRKELGIADQALCFLSGANSIFDGDKLLTTANNDRNEDLKMFDTLGLRSRPAFLPYESGNTSSAGGAQVVN